MTGSRPRSRSASSRPCAAEQEDLAALRQLPGQQPGRGLGAGDDVLVMGVDAELAQVLAHRRGRARSVVGHEGEVHAAGLRPVQRLRGTLDRVPPDVDDTVEVEDGHVVRRGQRLLARPEHRSLACVEGLLELRRPVGRVGDALAVDGLGAVEPGERVLRTAGLDAGRRRTRSAVGPPRAHASSSSGARSPGSAALRRARRGRAARRPRRWSARRAGPARTSPAARCAPARARGRDDPAHARSRP